MMNKAALDKCLGMYPLLGSVLRGGSVSRKMTREILSIDKYLMDELYRELIICGAIVVSPSGYFRATAECSEYIGRNA